MAIEVFKKRYLVIGLISVTFLTDSLIISSAFSFQFDNSVNIDMALRPRNISAESDNGNIVGLSIFLEILSTIVFGREKKGEVGIDRLIGEGAFSAAYPLHDVISLSIQ